MANRDPGETSGGIAANRVSSPVEELLLAALERAEPSKPGGTW